MRDTNAADIFPSGAFDTTISGEIRQPLLQGSGVEYNRIAGPGGKPGAYNGVLVARIRTDISAADFQAGLRDFVATVENAYWDLYFAYRDLDVKIQARDEALETWRRVRALNLAGGGARRGGEADKEAQAREQYFRFQADVENALMGYPEEGTRTYNGTAPGTFRALPGVQLAERRLRLAMGLPATGEQLLRPADEPTMAPITFDWPSLSVEALFRREELRRQRWLIKSRELELTASQNFLKPNLDFDARYGLRGFGKDLTENEPGDQSSYANLFATEHQEWQVGLEFSMPLGFRQGNAAVRNAELRLSQAKVVLREGERTVINQLSESVAEVDRAYALLQNDIYRTKAAKDQLAALEAVYQAKQEGFFEVLDAQRRLSEAISEYYQSRVQYAMAIRNVHYQKGSLLDYCEVSLAEGAWPDKAYRDAMRRAEHRGQREVDRLCLCAAARRQCRHGGADPGRRRPGGHGCAGGSHAARSAAKRPRARSRPRPRSDARTIPLATWASTTGREPCDVANVGWDQQTGTSVGLRSGFDRFAQAHHNPRQPWPALLDRGFWWVFVGLTAPYLFSRRLLFESKHRDRIGLERVAAIAVVGAVPPRARPRHNSVWQRCCVYGP